MHRKHAKEKLHQIKLNGPKLKEKQKISRQSTLENEGIFRINFELQEEEKIFREIKTKG